MRLRVAIAVVVLSLGTLMAQTFRGGIQGTVTDSSGAAVAGAQVTATNVGTALTRSTTTGDQGDYVFNELPLGEYSMTVSKGGFKTQTVKGIQVEVAASQHVDVKLTPGEVKETVEVTAEVPLVDTTSNVLGGTISGKAAADLPISGRDFIKLMVMVPGATADASGVSDSPGTFGQFSINGNRGRANNYLLDGTDMNDGYRNDSAINEAGVFGTPATLLPIEAVAEFPILSNVQAEYGRNSGAIVNIVTKSGTNSFHGSVFEYFRNDALDARNFFNQSSFPQSKFRNNQFGGALGGPIWKDRTFFYAAYEGQRERVGIPTVSVIPTQDQINCFVANGNTIHPIISNLLALNPWTQGSALPVSGDGGAATLGDLCVTNPATPLSTTLDASGSNDLSSFIGKIDHHFGKGDVLTGRYFYGHSDQSFPLGLVGGSAVPGYNTVTPTTVHLVSVSYTHTFSPQTLLEMRFGYNRFFETFFPQDKAFDPASIGLNSVSNPQDFGLPLLQFFSETFTNLPAGDQNRTLSSIGANSSVPRGRTDTNWQFFGNMAHTHGRHNLKFGYEFRRTFVSQFFDAGFRGVLHFCSFDDFLQGTDGCGSLPHQLSGDTRRGTFQNSHGFYFQDDWRVSSRLTINWGLRWDYYGVIGEEKGRFSLFNGDVSAPAVLPTKQLYPKDLNNFGPRLAFSYDLFGDSKTVLRGGWGLYYDAFSQDFFEGQLPWPTFNSGPAYNFAGSSPISLTYTSNPMLGLDPACNPGSIPIPNSADCAAPLFVYDPTFGNDVFTVDQNIATPYIQNYNVNLQHEFNKNMAVQVGYVGSTGKKLFRYRDINQAGSLIGFPPPPDGFGFGYILQFESTATSQYNSLQTNFRLQNWHGLTSTVNYTWGHSIDDASDGLDDVPNTTQPNDSFNPRAERARSSFDTRHRFSWLYNYEFPKATRAKWLLSGWAMDGAFSYSSGQPFTVSYIANFCCDFDGMGEFFGRPDLVGDPFAGTNGPGKFLNLDAFAVPCTYGGAFSCAGNQHPGSSPRNAFNGPSYHNFDFSVSKTTPIGERVKVQLRVDAFNLFNHPNFTNPLLPNFFVDFTANGLNETVGPSFGHGNGFLPLTATPDVGIGNPFLGGGGPRNLQLGLKLTF